MLTRRKKWKRSLEGNQGIKIHLQGMFLTAKIRLWRRLEKRMIYGGFFFSTNGSA